MTRKKKVLLVSIAAALALITVGLAKTLRVSNGTWVFDSAPLPEGWPELSPVGAVEVKEYPDYRAAFADRASAGPETDSQFMTLFRHIQDEQIAMTAPVEMRWADDSPGGERAMDSMAFLYRSTEQGELGRAGAVDVVDVPRRTYAAVGVRGNYGERSFERGWAELSAWLEANSDRWEADGAPRYLGYNGPFVLPPWRYGEVVIPIRERQTVIESPRS